MKYLIYTINIFPVCIAKLQVIFHFTSHEMYFHVNNCIEIYCEIFYINIKIKNINLNI